MTTGQERTEQASGRHANRATFPREFGNTCRACGSGPHERCTVLENEAKAQRSAVGDIRHDAHFFRGWE